MNKVDGSGLLKIGENWLNPKKGRILVSEPFAGDYIFRKSVVYITEHSEKETSGFILNKPAGLDNPFLRIIGAMPFDISFGGPVAVNRLMFIHTLGQKVPGSEEISDGIYFGGDFRTVMRLLENGGAAKNDVRFFLGYSGWRSGQLEQEINSKFWIVGSLDRETVMNFETDIWAEAVKSLGGRYRFWQNLPANPIWN